MIIHPRGKGPNESNATKKRTINESAEIITDPGDAKTSSKPKGSSDTKEATTARFDVASDDAQLPNPDPSLNAAGNVEAVRESDDADSPTIFDPIVSKESWSRLFAKPAAPRCESHREPCMRLQSKKKGFNLGREFWMCARPLGPSGNKERGTQWRCTTFIWASDWQGANDGNRGEVAKTWDLARDPERN